MSKSTDYAAKSPAAQKSLDVIAKLMTLITDKKLTLAKGECSFMYTGLDWTRFLDFATKRPDEFLVFCMDLIALNQISNSTNQTTRLKIGTKDVDQIHTRTLRTEKTIWPLILNNTISRKDHPIRGTVSAKVITAFKDQLLAMFTTAFDNDYKSVNKCFKDTSAFALRFKNAVLTNTEVIELAKSFNKFEMDAGKNQVAPEVQKYILRKVAKYLALYNFSNSADVNECAQSVILALAKDQDDDKLNSYEACWRIAENNNVILDSTVGEMVRTLQRIKKSGKTGRGSQTQNSSSNNNNNNNNRQKKRNNNNGSSSTEDKEENTQPKDSTAENEND